MDGRLRGCITYEPTSKVGEKSIHDRASTGSRAIGSHGACFNLACHAHPRPVLSLCDFLTGGGERQRARRGGKAGKAVSSSAQSVSSPRSTMRFDQREAWGPRYLLDHLRGPSLRVVSRTIFAAFDIGAHGRASQASPPRPPAAAGGRPRLRRRPWPAPGSSPGGLAARNADAEAATHFRDADFPSEPFNVGSTSLRSDDSRRRKGWRPPPHALPSHLRQALRSLLFQPRAPPLQQQQQLQRHQRRQQLQPRQQGTRRLLLLQQLQQQR